MTPDIQIITMTSGTVTNQMYFPVNKDTPVTASQYLANLDTEGMTIVIEDYIKKEVTDEMVEKLAQELHSYKGSYMWFQCSADTKKDYLDQARKHLEAVFA